MPVKRTSSRHQLERIARPTATFDDASIVPLIAEADLYMRDAIIEGNLERIGEWFLDAAYQTVERHQLQRQWFGKECP